MLDVEGGRDLSWITGPLSRSKCGMGEIPPIVSFFIDECKQQMRRVSHAMLLLPFLGAAHIRACSDAQPHCLWRDGVERLVASTKLNLTVR